MQQILTAAAAFLSLSLILSANLSSSFSFPTFPPYPAPAASLSLFGDASASSADSSIRLTRPSAPTSGHLFYTKPLHLLLPTPPHLSSFSTSFSFSLPPSSSDGISFSLLPSPSPSLSPPLLSVLLSPSPTPSALNATTTVTIPDFPPLNSALDAGERLRSWIDYHSPSRNLEVRLAQSALPRPLDPLVSHPLNLSGVPDADLFVSIGSASRQNSSQACTVFSWSFALTDRLNSKHSEPLDPHALLEKTAGPTEPRRGSYTCRILAALLFGLGCGAGIAALVLFLWSAFVDRRLVAAKESPAHTTGFEYKKIVRVAITKPGVGKK